MPREPGRVINNTTTIQVYLLVLNYVYTYFKILDEIIFRSVIAIAELENGVMCT
jgi:hypothetical protein